MNTLQSKVAYITGGSEGIGYGIANALIDNGMNVSITSWIIEPWQQAEDKLSSSRNVLALQSEVSSYDPKLKAIEAMIKRFGKLDVVDANTGVSHFAPIQDLPAEQ